MSAQFEHDRPASGYVAPKRENKRAMTAFVAPEVFQRMHDVARRKNMTVGDALARAIEHFVNRNAPHPR